MIVRAAVVASVKVLNSAETMEERKQRVLEKATKLKNARESTR